MRRVFISYDHDDQQWLDTVRSLNSNPNSDLEFIDGSLMYPIKNEHGHVIRRPPSDPRSEPVKNEITKLLVQASKLLVLIGRDTHSSEWVKFEIETFISLKGSSKNVLLMRVPRDFQSGKPSNARHLEIFNWSVDKLLDWL